MALYAKDAGVWKTVIQPYVKVAGVWTAIRELWKHDGGTWKLVFTDAVYDLTPGTHEFSSGGSVSITITAIRAVTWTYTKSAALAASRASGTSGTSITFTQDVFAGGQTRTGTASLSANDGGTVSNWALTLTALGTEE